MRLRILLAVVLALSFATSGITQGVTASSPAYAQAGAFATYTAEGGFIPYFSGVSGNITYTVTQVFGNGSMGLRVFENITAGTDLPPFITTFNTTDTVANPHIFPVVSVDALASHSVHFQNVSASFMKNVTISVPAGQFMTMEFSGAGANDTTYYFWFEPSSGLVIEENGGTSAVQLDSTNVVIPLAPPDLLSTEIPYEMVFVLAFAIGGVMFLWLRHHYTTQAAKAAAEKTK